MHAVIVGGGIAGLAAAYELTRRGVPFVLLEASPRVGGIIRTDYEGDLVIDAGPDGFLARKRAAIDLCRDLGIENRLVVTNPPRMSFILRDGTLHPIKTAVGSYLARDPEGDESIAAYFERRYGSDAVEHYAEPLLAGIHAGDVRRLSIRALFPEFIVSRKPAASRSSHEEPAAPDPDGPFRSFPRGMQELVDALVRALPRGAIRTTSLVRSIRRSGARYTIATDAESFDAKHLILAVPAHVTASLVRDLDPQLANLCAGIRYVSSGIVVLAYPRQAVDHPLAGGGFVVPRRESGLGILAATWLSSKWPGRAPADVALMRAFFGGGRDPEAMTLSDAELATMAHHDLSSVLSIHAQPTFTRVYRWNNGNPQYEIGYLDLLKAIRVRVAALPRVHLTGAGFGTIGVPDCIAAGRSVAAAVKS